MMSVKILFEGVSLQETAEAWRQHRLLPQDGMSFGNSKLMKRQMLTSIAYQAGQAWVWMSSPRCLKDDHHSWHKFQSMMRMKRNTSGNAWTPQEISRCRLHKKIDLDLRPRREHLLAKLTSKVLTGALMNTIMALQPSMMSLTSVLAWFQEAHHLVPMLEARAQLLRCRMLQASTFFEMLARAHPQVGAPLH
jgi:hypothetical protein